VGAGINLFRRVGATRRISPDLGDDQKPCDFLTGVYKISQKQAARLRKL
jgi:hypothetical protein